MKTPDPDSLRLAALWCRNNEGDDDERLPLIAVADWLEKQADAKEVREAARSVGVPVSKVREAMRGRRPRPQQEAR